MATKMELLAAKILELESAVVEQQDLLKDNKHLEPDNMFLVGYRMGALQRLQEGIIDLYLILKSSAPLG
jgi:hypothetical protein